MMKTTFLILLALVAVALAGCNDSKNDPVPLHPPYLPGILAVEQLDEAPTKFVSWSQIPQNERPAELPPLFSKALQNQPNGAWSQEIEDDRGQAIIDGLHNQWNEQVGATPPRPLPVYYNGEYFEVLFGHSETRADH